MITVKKMDDNTFEVTVADSSTTTHIVNVSEDYYQQLTGAKVSKEELIEKSFEFLLERESNTMILGQFDLPVIQQYFSDYQEDIKNRIG